MRLKPMTPQRDRIYICRSYFAMYLMRRAKRFRAMSEETEDSYVKSYLTVSKSGLSNLNNSIVLLETI